MKNTIACFFFVHRKTLLETTADDVMGTRTKPGQESDNAAGPRSAGRGGGGADGPLPTRPVIHRRRLDPRTPGSRGTYDLDKMTVSQQPERQENSAGTRETRGFSQASKLLESHRQEVELDRLIHAKKLLLLESLLNFEDKVRQKLQGAGTTAGGDGRHEEKSLSRALRPQARVSERHREGGMEEAGQRLRTRQRDGRRKTHEEDGDGWRLAGVRPESRTKAFHETVTPHKPAHSLPTEKHRGAGGSSLPPISNPSRSRQHELRSPDASFELLPCTICNRNFLSGRLEKHLQVCKKLNQSRRRVFNSYVNRTKGSAIEQFWKTNSRSKTLEEF